MKKFLVASVFAISALVSIGCEKESEAEKAGDAIDNAFQDAKDKLND